MKKKVFNVTIKKKQFKTTHMTTIKKTENTKVGVFVEQICNYHLVLGGLEFGTHTLKNWLDL